MGVIKDIGTSAKLEFFERIRVESKIFKGILDFGLKCLRLRVALELAADGVLIQVDFR